MVDLFNVLQGGLDKNLESWDIRDKDGNPIRKLTMDYVNDNIEDCADYLIVDGVGLYYLTVKFSNTMQSITGYSYLDGDYITSGGVAKKVMLKEMYNCEYKDALKEFHKDFPMNAAMDDMFRDGHLYKGGMVVVNPKYKYRIVTNVYKLDENSMYPHKQSTMKLPYGKPTIYKDYIPSNHIKIFHITSMYGTLKPNKVGVWQDLTYKEYTDVIDETNSFFIFEEELNELKNVKRPEVIKALKEARALGDLSENADYDAARAEQAQVEGRIQELEKIMENAHIIKKGSTDKVSLGTTVKIKYVDDDEIEEYRIVGSKEADPSNNKISNESPIAMAIMNAKAGEIRKVASPNGEYEVEIVEIC